MSNDIRQAARRKGTKASWLRTFSAVMCSFFGVRKGSDQAQDIEKLNPVHVIVAGLLAAAAFVAVLLVVVNLVVNQA
ncbi:MAG: DUF2970 domain-containing protein [Limnobacter sp.]|nr:DUF2970 domain-containing protein [Limnobacter sp.]